MICVFYRQLNLSELMVVKANYIIRISDILIYTFNWTFASTFYKIKLFMRFFNLKVQNHIILRPNVNI